MEYIDITLLRAMRIRSYALKIRSVVNTQNHHKVTKFLIGAIGNYYDQYDHECINFEVFIPFIDGKYLNTKTPEEKEAILNTVKNIAAKELDQNTIDSLVDSLYELNLIANVKHITTKYLDGEDIDAPALIEENLDLYKKNCAGKELPEVTKDIGEILDSLENEEGLFWRLNCLNSVMRPLQTGILGVIAARPDAGKTSFFCSEITHFATQIHDDRCILWLNNEGQGYAIKPRLMQSALNCTLEELIALKNEGVLYDRYYEAIGGEHKIRIMDIHGYTKDQVESIIIRTNPRLVTFDMVDNIRGFGNETRTDLALERMYQWAREAAVKYDFTGLATSQISEAGHNTMYPPMAYLKDSRTGKQGACDFQLMIGSLQDDAQYASTRWLSLPKNKLRRTGAKTLESKVIFDRDKVRYHDTDPNLL